MSGRRTPAIVVRLRALLADRRINVVVRSGGFLMIFAGFLLALNGGLIPGLWLVILGWLITRSTRAAYNTGRLTSLLDGLVARDALEADPAAIAPTLTLETLVAQDERQTGGSGVYAVRQGGELVGIVDVLDADRIARGEWATTHVDAIMRPVAELEAVPPERPLLEIVARFEQTRREAFPVVDGTTFLGLVTRERVHALMRSRNAQVKRERSRARPARR